MLVGSLVISCYCKFTLIWHLQKIPVLLSTNWWNKTSPLFWLTVYISPLAQAKAHATA